MDYFVFFFLETVKNVISFGEYQIYSRQCNDYENDGIDNNCYLLLGSFGWLIDIFLFFCFGQCMACGI